MAFLLFLMAGVLTLSRHHGEQTGFVKLAVDDGTIDWRQWDAEESLPFHTLTDWRNWTVKLQDAFTVLGGGTLTATAWHK